MRFSELAGRVHPTKEPVVVERNGEPLAVVVSPEQYEEIARLEARAWGVVDAVRARTAGRDPDELLRDVTEVVEEVREQLHGEGRRPKSGR